MSTRPLRIFISSAGEDADLVRSGLAIHLKIAERSGFVAVTGSHKAPPGVDHRAWVVAEIEQADIVLLFVSPWFFASDDIFDIELAKAMQRHEEGAARVIPVLAKPVELARAPFSDLMSLPRNQVPVSLWKSADEAWFEITREILGVVEHLRRAPASGSAAPSRTATATKNNNNNNNKKLKMLFISASPEGTPGLAVDEELRLIQERIRMAEHRDAFEIVVAPAARPDDLLQALLQHAPDVIHLSVHGHEAGGLLLEGSREPIEVISAAALQRLLKEFPSIRLAVLNACYSIAEATAIADTVDVTIAMRGAVRDRAAIDFAGAFYSALGFGRSLKQAFDLGRAALLAKGAPEADAEIPELIPRRGVDPGAIHLVSNT